MGQLPSPNQGKKFKKVEGSEGYYYDESHKQMVTEYKPIDPNKPNLGVTEEQKIIDVPHNPEVIDLRTGASNSQYWQPEMVMNPSDCDHEFFVTHLGKREIECSKCQYGTTFHPAINFFEDNGHPSILLKNRYYPISF